MLLEHPWLAALTVLMLAASLVGTLLNVGMAVLTFVRKNNKPPINTGERITVRRALRYEVGFAILQVLGLATSVWSAVLFTHVYPTAPTTATTFFVVTMVMRSLFSVTLAGLSLFDLRDVTLIREWLEAGRPE